MKEFTVSRWDHDTEMIANVEKKTGIKIFISLIPIALFQLGIMLFWFGSLSERLHASDEKINTMTVMIRELTTSINSITTSVARLEENKKNIPSQ